MVPLQKYEAKKHFRVQLRTKAKLGVVLSHTCDPRSWRVDSRTLRVEGHLWLHSDLEASLSYMKPL